MEQFRPTYGMPYGYGTATGFPGQPYQNIPNAVPNFQPQPPIQQQPQRPVISGRTVASEGEIRPNEIPMDGSISLFPLSDYSAVFAKQWKADGLIHTVKFIPAPSEPAPEPEKSFNETILERFDRIEKMLTSNSKKTARKDETDG